jgi:hypothetical protein
MAVTSLSLPIDIPWERICVSEDMIDPKVCDSDRPAKWQSSIAVFKYVPDDEYQIYPQRKITYLKITCTVAGYQPKADEIEGLLANWSSRIYAGEPYSQGELERRLLEYKPCHEAIVQVTVGPDPRRKIPLDEYPYIMDFQPKKRELYESVTDTKELMSRSLESLNIRKSSGSTESQEVLDIDQGFNIGAGGQYAGTGGSFQFGEQGQWGTKHLAGGESGLARTTDESRERRETTSHTTQLTQLHHLLDTYHQGTNRVVFYIQPRPHTVQPPSGFVRGPREVEGIQEFFLVVNQPEDQEDFCLDVRVDTGHLFQQRIMEYEYRQDTVTVPFANPAPVRDDTDTTPDGDTTRTLVSHSNDLYNYTATIPYHCFRRTRQNGSTYKSPFPEYVIDVTNLGGQPDNVGGYHVLPSTQVTGNATYAVTTTPDGELLTITIEAPSRACFKGGVNEISVSSTITASEAILIAIAATTVIGNPLGPIAAAILTTGASAIATFEAADTAIAYASAPGAMSNESGSANVELQVFLRSRERTKDTGRIENMFFITTRGLCCCGDRPRLPDGIVYFTGIAHSTSGRPPGTTSTAAGPALASAEPAAEATGTGGPEQAMMTIEEANGLQTVLRDEMLRSLVSPRRTEPRSIAETGMLVGMVLPYVQRDQISRVLLRQSATDIVPEDLAEPLSRVFRKNIREISRLDLLSINTSVLARAADVDEAAINQLKTDVLSKPFRAPDEGGGGVAEGKTSRTAGGSRGRVAEGKTDRTAGGSRGRRSRG